MKLLTLSCLLMTAALVGCGDQRADYSKVELVDVSGTVTLDGLPLKNAVVTFENPETGSFSYGMTNSEGAYTLQLDSEQSGVTPGEKIVRISTARKILGLNSEEEGGEGGEEEEQSDPADRSIQAADGEEMLPPVYHAESVLRANVSQSETEFNFDLTTSGEPA